jgi:DhnA family fructose-bisphosphate aldolase class Ia
MFASVRDAWNMGAVAVGATVYFGSAESNRQMLLKRPIIWEWPPFYGVIPEMTPL